MKKTYLVLLLASVCMGVAHAEHDGAQHEKKELTKAEFTERAAKHFDLMDADGNGVVTVQERQALREKWRTGHAERKRKRQSETPPN